MTRIAVLGAGSWGTTLADLLARKGHEVTIWAYEAEVVDYNYDRNRHTVQRARKSRTFFFNALTADGFDQVINPAPIEPVVQFTLYLKVKYELEPSK